MSEGRASERTGGVDILDFLDLLRIVNQIQIKLITVNLELNIKKHFKKEKLNQGLEIRPKVWIRRSESGGCRRQREWHQELTFKIASC